MSAAPKAIALRDIKPGKRAKLEDGTHVIVSSLVGGDVFARVVLEDDWQYLPNRFGERLGELHVQAGGQLVQEVR